jgi:hypothetical protein
VHGGGDAVHVSDALLGESLAEDVHLAFFGLQFDASDQADLRELVQAVANVFTGSHASLLGLGSSAVLGSVVPSKVLDTNGSSFHVELVGNAGGTVVEPVVVLGWQFLLAASLNVGAPLLSIIN